MGGAGLRARRIGPSVCYTPCMRLAVFLLAGLLAACAREPTPVNLATDIAESVARPLLRDGLVAQQATIVRTKVADADLLWDSDPQRVLALAAAGELAPLPETEAADRPASLVDARRRWAATDAVARVLVYDPERIAEASAPTRVAALADAAQARQLVLADPARGAAAWHAAALFDRLGDEAGAAFFAQLRTGGALLVADDDAVVTALVAGQRPLALLASDRAAAAQAQAARLIIVVPDQDAAGSGAFVLPSVAAVTRRGAANPSALALAQHLLAPPQAFRMALARNTLVVAPDAAAPPGLLNVSALRLMPVDYAALAVRLPAVRTALAH